MHDTILLNKISSSLEELCRNHNIKRVGKLAIIVDENSHINSSNLYQHLRQCNEDLVGEWTNIIVENDQLDSQVAILHSIEGDKGQ